MCARKRSSTTTRINENCIWFSTKFLFSYLQVFGSTVNCIEFTSHALTSRQCVAASHFEDALARRCAPRARAARSSRVRGNRRVSFSKTICIATHRPPEWRFRDSPEFDKQKQQQSIFLKDSEGIEAFETISKAAFPFSDRNGPTFRLRLKKPLRARAIARWIILTCQTWILEYNSFYIWFSKYLVCIATKRRVKKQIINDGNKTLTLEFQKNQKKAVKFRFEQ